MQTLSISNLLPAKAPVPGAELLLSPSPQQSAPFAALFLANLKEDNDVAKLPAAGRVKDSAHPQYVSSTTLDSPAPAPRLLGPMISSPVPAAQPLSTPVNATNPDSTSNHDLIVALAATQSPASAIPSTDAGEHNTQSPEVLAAPAGARSLTPAPTVRTNVTLVATVPQPGAITATLDSKLITQFADTSPDLRAPSDLPATGSPHAQDSAKPQDAVAAPPNSQNLSSSRSARANVPRIVNPPQLIANVATLDSPLVTQIADTAPNRHLPSNLPFTGAPRRPDGAKPQDAVPAPPRSQNLLSPSSVGTNVAPVTTVPEPVANLATLDSKQVTQIADTSPERNAPSNLPSTSTPRRPGNAKSPDAVAAPPDTKNISSSVSVQTNMPPVAMVPQPTLPSATLDLNIGASIIDAAPNLDAPTNLFSTGAPQGQGKAEVTHPDHRSATPNTSGVPTFQVFQRARATFEFLSLQTSKVPGNSSVEIARSPATGDTSQFIPKMQTGAAAVASGTPAQTSTKTIAIGASTPTFHESLEPPAESVSQPGPGGAAAAPSQSKDISSGPQGNNANTKSVHASNFAGGRVDGKVFVQTLETAGANTGNAHAESLNSTMVAATMRTPVDPNGASVDRKPGTGSGAPLAQGQALPAPAGTNQTVVSSARLLDHPGQSEIRIEMQADSLGGVEMRAHISGNRVGASIAVEHHDAQVLLANDLPALHSALIEKNLRVDSLSVSQGMPSLMSGGHGNDAGQRGSPQAQPKAFYTAGAENSVQVQDVPAVSLGASNVNARLSVLA
jgi:flagellar hook-length control protein FliK